MSFEPKPSANDYKDVREVREEPADGHLFELLHQLITPGPASPFGELGLEGFLREFWAGFAGDAEATEAHGDWARLKRFNDKFLNTAALGALISRTRINAERAIERVVAEAAAEASATGQGAGGAQLRRPVMVDAIFIKTHGWTLLAALAGALTQAIAAENAEPRDRPRLRLPRLPLAMRRPWRFDVLSIGEAVIGGLFATGRSVSARLGAIASVVDFRALDVPHLMALAATMLPFLTDATDHSETAATEDAPVTDEGEP